MEELIYFCVRIVCIGYLLYCVYGWRRRIETVCTLLYGKPCVKKEKKETAKRAGIKEIIMSAENKKNIDEIQDLYLKGLTFHYVNDIKEVFAIALTNEKVADAIDLSVKKPSQE